MTVGAGVWTRHGTFGSRGLCVARKREAALPSGGQPLVERSASRECLHESWPSTWPTRPIVSAVRCGSSAWHQGPKETGRVAEVGSAVSCLHLPRFRESPSCSDRCAGSMWPVERFAVPGSPTGAGNMLKCFHWLRPSRRPSLLLVLLVRCVRIRAFVGRIGSHATPGGDHHNCV